MAHEDIFTVPADLILNPTGYNTGGTSLGILASVIPVGFGLNTTLMSNQVDGGQWNDARVFPINLVLEVTLLERSAEVLGLLFSGRAVATNVFSNRSVAPGQRSNGTAFEKELLIRPVDKKGDTVTTKPFTYLPRALVTNLGPVTYAHGIKQMEATKIGISALKEGTLGEAWYWGDPAASGDNFPSL